VKVLKAVAPVVVLVGAVLGARWLVMTRPEPKKKPREERAVLVEAQPVHRGDTRVTVRGNGTVIPAYSVDVMAEVGGRVVWKHPQLTTGGLVRKGDTLLRIDPRDYKLAVAQQKAALERTRTEIALERGRAAVAAREWEMFSGEGAKAPGNEELALRKPQLRAAELAIESAEASLEQAKLQLGKTTLTAPFDAVVRTNATEEGRLVMPQQVLAELVNTRVFMVAVSVPVDELQWLKIPGTNAPLLTDEAVREAYDSDDPAAAFAEMSSLALVTQEVGQQVVQRPGIIVRMLGDLDPVGRMARLLVSIRDPLGRETAEQQAEGGGDGASRDENQLPILLGAYVSVELQGKRADDVIEIPWRTLREGDRVHVYDDGKLDIRQVEILRSSPESVLVQRGLSDGDMLITSTLTAPVQGMDLRLVSERDPEAPPAGGPDGGEGASDTSPTAPGRGKAEKGEAPADTERSG
jgi:multidrug efflux pump subunit AcrA (membrane-fusion protein)